MSQAMQQDTISDAIDVATTRVKDQLNATTPKGQTTKTATKPPNATKRKQLFSGKRVRTESKKARLAAERRAKKAKEASSKPAEHASSKSAEQATSKSAFRSESLNKFREELRQTGVEEVFLNSSDSDVSSNIGSGNDSGDDDDAQEEQEEQANVGGDEPTQLPSDDDDDTGMPQRTRVDIDLSEDSDNENPNTQVEEFDQSQRVDARNHMEPQIEDENEVVVDDAKQHYLDTELLDEYEKLRNCDAKKLYEFAKTVFTDEDIEAFMERETKNPNIRVDNHCFNMISSMVTGDFRGEKRHYETLMVMFIAELLKNIDETFTGIQNAFDQTSNYVDVRVKQVIQTVNNKSEGTKTIHTFVKQLFAEMESHGKWQPEEVFNHMFVEDDEPNIEGILRETKLQQLQSLNLNNVNPNELNLLTMFPLDDLCILDDIESLRKEFRDKNPKPKKPDMERALELSSSEELHAYFAEYKQKDEAYKKKEKDFVETARHNAKKESFLLTLLKSTSLILDCCKKGDEESFQTLQKSIRKLAKAFKKRVKAASQEVQAAVRLGYEKLRLYQTIFANEKSEPERYTYYVEKSLAFCFENAIKMKKNNAELQYIDYEPEDKKKDKKKNDAFYQLKSQKEWAKRITGLQLHVNSKGKSCFLPPPILDEGLNDEVATEKKFKHFFAVLHLASMSHCLMDRRAFYHPRYYGLYDVNKVACPCYRWNQALTLLSEVFLKPSDLKK